MEPAPDEPSPAAGRRLTVIGVIVSVALHVAVMVALRWIAPHETARTVSVIDISTAPLPPKAEALGPEQEAPPEEIAQPVDDGELEMPETPPQTADGFGLVDAGVPMDAGEEVAAVDAGRRADAAQVAAGGGGDGGVEGGDGGTGGELVAADLADGGVADDGGAVADDGDGGVLVAAGEPGDGGLPGGLPGGTGDGGVGAIGPVGNADPVGDIAAKPSSGTAANLLNYFPRGHVVTVMARLDRLRGTEWAEQIDNLIKPLPDYYSLAGNQDVRMSDGFDLLVISSPTPTDALATSVMVRTRMTPPEFRDFLDQPDAPVTWSPVKGGTLGKRGKSARVPATDDRVFLSWEPGWMILTQPRNLGPLVTPRPGGQLDLAARAIDLPPWLARAQTIAGESGEPTGPAFMVTAANLFPAEIPMMGVNGASLPGPEQVTITLEIVAGGLELKGNLRYADDSAAATAHDAIERFRVGILDDLGSRFLLERVGAVNPLKGLTLKRTGRRLAFATSASVAEGRAILAVVSTFVTAHFEERRPVPVRRTPP